MNEYEIWYLVVNKKTRLVHRRRCVDGFEAKSKIEARAIAKEREAALEAEVIQLYEDEDWFNVNEYALVMEVERVYATRWDCMTRPEGVRRAA